MRTRRGTSGPKSASTCSAGAGAMRGTKDLLGSRRADRRLRPGQGAAEERMGLEAEGEVELAAGDEQLDRVAEPVVDVRAARTDGHPEVVAVAVRLDALVRGHEHVLLA